MVGVDREPVESGSSRIAPAVHATPTTSYCPHDGRLLERGTGLSEINCVRACCNEPGYRCDECGKRWSHVYVDGHRELFRVGQ